MERVGAVIPPFQGWVRLGVTLGDAQGWIIATPEERAARSQREFGGTYWHYYLFGS